MSMTLTTPPNPYKQPKALSVTINTMYCIMKNWEYM